MPGWRPPARDPPNTPAGHFGTSRASQSAVPALRHHMANAEGVWLRVGMDTEETTSQLSLVAPSQAEPASTPATASSHNPNAVTRTHCYGPRLCPWCLFGCSMDEHGRLDAVFAKYHILQASAAAGTSGLTVPQESCLWGSYKLLLLVAAMQINDCGRHVTWKCEFRFDSSCSFGTVVVDVMGAQRGRGG